MFIQQVNPQHGANEDEAVSKIFDLSPNLEIRGAKELLKKLNCSRFSVSPGADFLQFYSLKLLLALKSIFQTLLESSLHNLTKYAIGQAKVLGN